MDRTFKKMSISMCSETLKRLEEYAKSNGLTRSAAISVLINQSLSYQDALTVVGVDPELIGKMRVLNLIASDK